MIDLLWLTALTFAFGPFGSIPYAFASGLSTIDTAILVSTVHAALVPIWFGILELTKYGFLYENRLTSKIAKTALNRSKKFQSSIKRAMRDFERRIGQRGLGIGVIGFTFMFGVFWAALVAVLLNIKRNTMMVSIAIGAVISSVFWTFVFAGFVGFLPSPWLIYLVLVIVTLLIFGYKKIRERRVLREISRVIKKEEKTG